MFFTSEIKISGYGESLNSGQIEEMAQALNLNYFIVTFSIGLFELLPGLGQLQIRQI
jgi:hypothetical protein